MLHMSSCRHRLGFAGQRRSAQQRCQVLSRMRSQLGAGAVVEEEGHKGGHKEGHEEGDEEGHEEGHEEGVARRKQSMKI